MSAFLDPASRVLPARGTRVAVLGLGVSGEAAARRLLELGCDVTVADRRDDEAVRARAAALGGARAVLGAPGAAPIDGADLLIVSPGIAPSSHWLAQARDAGVPVWSEIELAWRLTDAPIVGVTGTNGKTTTTRMISESLTAAGLRAPAAGNIGTALADAVMEPHDVLVAELSSFQLHHVVSFRGVVGVLLNVADDHLDWHGSFEAYAAAKGRLFENQSAEDAAVVGPGCEAWVRGPARRVPFTVEEPPGGGAGVVNGWIVVPEGRVVEVAEMRARHAPAVANAVAAAAAACAFGAAPDAVGRALAAFRPLPHRTEPVADVAGVAFVDDSKATNPHATLSALGGFERVILIAGGRNKGLDLGVLASEAHRVRAVVAIGEASDEVERTFASAGVPVHRAGGMDEAVERAAALAEPGDTVLLSPACASFDMFAGYEARGRAFRAAVERLVANASAAPAGRSARAGADAPDEPGVLSMHPTTNGGGRE